MHFARNRRGDDTLSLHAQNLQKGRKTMFGKQIGRARHGISHQVQDWVDDGMELIRDGAKEPVMWGAALSVAVAAFVGYAAYRNREPGSNGAKASRRAVAKVLPARARKADRRRIKSAARTIGAKKKPAARHTSAG
jgi:hypothetical protein